MAAVVAGTIAAFVAASNRESTFAHRRDDASAQRTAAAAGTVFGSALATLSGASALRAPGGEVDPAAFAAFGKEVTTHSSLNALAVSELVPAADRTAFEAATGHPITDRGEGGKFVPAADRPEYYPVRYALPDDPTRRALLGFDVAGDRERRASVQRTAATGVPQVAPVRLAPSGRPGLFVVYPITDGGRVVAVVSSAFLGADLAPLIAKLLPAGSRFALRTPDGATLAASAPGPFESTTRVRLSGLDLTVAADDGVATATTVPRFVLGGGLLLALFLALLLRSSFRHERDLSAAAAAAEASEHRASGLLDVTTTLARGLTAAAVSSSLLRWGDEQLGAVGGAVARIEPDGELAVVGLRGEFVPDALMAAPAATAPAWQGEPSAPGAEPGASTGVSLPLVADDTVVGVAAFVFDPPVAPDDPRRALAEGVAPQAARALVRASRRDRELEVTLALQARLLPVRLPDVPGLDIAARYRAAAAGTFVGGDWYDVITLPVDRVLLTVGDVVGRGPAAAALMGQLRTLIHEAALRADDPASAVHSVDAFAARTEEATGSTCVAVELDPRTGDLRYCRAGHPWPLVVGPSGPRWLDRPGGGPLGVNLGRPPAAVDRLAPDESLVLFTDGAVERRAESIEAGLARLVDTARESWSGGPDALCDAILGGVPSETDDVVLLVAART